MRAQVLAAKDALEASLLRFAQRADADLAALLQQELLECVDLYDGLKTRAGALDFLDLLLRARNLVRDCAPVRHAFQQRFSNILVDEFQDTDPLQAEILLLLAGREDSQLPGSRHGRSGAWGRTRPGARSPEPGAQLAEGRSPKGSLVRRRRPEAVDLPLPPRRRRHLPGSLRPARSPGCATRLPADELPQRPRHPARGERRVCAGDAARCGVTAGRLRSACPVQGEAQAQGRARRLQAPGSRLQAWSGPRSPDRARSPESGARSQRPRAMSSSPP